MTDQDDKFDASLRAAFEKADAQITPDPQFNARVESRLARVVNPRTLLLSGAGASGSALAMSQMERLADGLTFHSQFLTWIFDTIGPQSIIAVVFALMAVSFTFLLPGKRI